MNYVHLKNIIKKFNEKAFLQYNAIHNIDIHGYIPKSFHDPKIDKIRNSDQNYNFLELSAYYGNYAAFIFFLKELNGKLFNQENKEFPLIFYALLGKNDNIIGEIIKRGQTNEQFLTLYDGLFFSLKLGYIQYVNYFFNEAKDKRPQDDAETVLYDIFRSGDHKLRSPLKTAIKSRNIMCVGFILNISQMEIPFLIGTKQKRKGMLTPLNVAARYGCGDIIYLLISLEPKMIKKKGSNKYFYPFVDAVKYNASLLNYEEFFKHGANKFINATDSDNNNALHYAIKHGNVEAVDILLKNSNIDVNATGEEKKAPIHFASQVCSIDILKKLLDHKDINIFAKDTYNNYATHTAAESNWPEGFLMILREMVKRKIKDDQNLDTFSKAEFIRPISEPSASFEEQQLKSHFFIPNPDSIFTKPNSISSITSLANCIPPTDCVVIDQQTALTKSDNENNTSLLFPSSSNSSAYNSANSSSEIMLSSSVQANNQFPSSTDIFKNEIQITTNEPKICLPRNSLLKEDNSTDEDSLLFLTREILFAPNDMGLCCFHISAIKNCVKIFECLDQNYPQLVPEILQARSGLTGFTVLHYLAMCNHSELLKSILDKHEIDVNVYGTDPIVTPLYQASKFDREECVKILRLHGADSTKMSKRPRDPKQFIHTQFMRVLLYSDEKTLETINFEKKNINTKNKFDTQENNNISQPTSITDTYFIPKQNQFEKLNPKYNQNL